MFFPFIFHKRFMSKTEEVAATTEGKKAPKDAPPAHLGWNSHEAVVSPIHVVKH